MGRKNRKKVPLAKFTSVVQ